MKLFSFKIDYLFLQGTTENVKVEGGQRSSLLHADVNTSLMILTVSDRLIKFKMVVFCHLFLDKKKATF